MNTDDYYCKLILPELGVSYTDITSVDPKSKVDFPKDKPRWVEFIDKVDINPEVKYLFRLLGVEPVSMRAFRWRPGRPFPWHIDGNKQVTTPCAMNWVLTDAGRVEFCSKVVFPDEPDYPYAVGKSDDSQWDNQVECSTDAKHVLVNTTIPHRVVVDEDVHRVSVSVIFNSRFSYHDVLSRAMQIGITDR